MAKLMPGYEKLNLVHFNCIDAYMFWFVGSHDDFREAMPDKYGLPDDVPADGHYYGFAPGQIFIWLRTKNVQILVHEAYHAICALCRYKGIPLCEETEEVRALLLDFLVIEIMGEKHALIR